MESNLTKITAGYIVMFVCDHKECDHMVIFGKIKVFEPNIAKRLKISKTAVHIEIKKFSN